MSAFKMRVGIGYDVHRFEGSPRPRGRNGRGKRPLRLGGITIPFPRGLAGHSDADVLLHAVADALLGAAGAPDLGTHFPSSDPRYRRADSGRFVRKALAIVRANNLAVSNMDATIIADAPNLAGHKALMRRALSRLLEIEPARVSVKAKTSEGFAPGKGGIAAHAVVLLRRAGGRPRARGRTARRR